MTEHARLGPSSAKKWLSCTPSVMFEEQFIDSASTYAEEGTEAHALAEMILNNTSDNKIQKWIADSKYYSTEMSEYIHDYCDIVMDIYNNALARSGDALLLTEQRLDFSRWVPQGFGTGDVVIIADDAIDIIDLKYGKGYEISAIDNPQLKLYGLGALSAYADLYDINTVNLTIIQPRLNNVSSYPIKVDELYQWADKYVKPAANKAWVGAGEFCPGEHCASGFCKGRNTCKAYADYNMQMFKYDLVEANVLSNEDIADILTRIDSLTRWASDIKAHALSQAESNGAKYPGFKLVEGRSRRVIPDETAVAEALIADGYHAEMLYKPKKLETLSNIEKLVGKKHLIEICGDLIIKPTGKPTLVPMTDKRPEISTAQSAINDFKNHKQ